MVLLLTGGITSTCTTVLDVSIIPRVNVLHEHQVTQRTILILEYQLKSVAHHQPNVT